jgi:predicted MFS family arabinose efflux permease
MYVAGNTLGGLSGRLIATNIGEAVGWHWGLFAMSVLSAVAAVLFMMLMPRTVVPPGKSLPLWRATRDNLLNPGVMVMVAQALLLMGGFVAVYNYLAFRLQQQPFGLTLAQASWLFLAYLAGAFSSRAVWMFTKRVPALGMLLVSLTVMLGGLALTLMPNLVLIIVGLVIFTVGFFGVHSLALALVARRAAPGSRSIAPSLYYLGYYAGSTLFGWAGGFAFTAGGWGGVAAMVGALVLLAGALAWGHAARHGGVRRVDA